MKVGDREGIEMPLWIQIDFRTNGQLGAWWSRDHPSGWTLPDMGTRVGETRVREVLIALANELDPLAEIEPETLHEE